PRFASTPLLAADHPLVPGEIHETSPVLEACGFEEALHHSSLACAHLEGQHPPRHQVRRYLLGQAPVEVESIGASVEGTPWLVVFDVGLERIDLGAGDVGGVCQDDLEASAGRERRGQVTEQEADPPERAVGEGVASCYFESAWADVGARHLPGGAA